jgi:hypothetical protein
LCVACQARCDGITNFKQGACEEQGGGGVIRPQGGGANGGSGGNP